MMEQVGTLLWWGRFDPEYSRNRVLRAQLAKLGWKVRDFHPAVSGLGDVQAQWQRLQAGVAAVWVPCFRQRDMKAAARWARRSGVPLIFDPLISAYDKQVDERAKLAEGSWRAQRLLAWERKIFSLADRVVADTPAHADYFQQVLGVPRERLSVLMVGAEEGLFSPCPAQQENKPLEVLFYGSFIPLQGPQVIVDAARCCADKDVVWTLLGDGPLRESCEQAAKGLENVRFEDWVPYEQLPQSICKADILLGIFGTTTKAGRVVPNKAYQALASGRPLVTRSSNAYPREVLEAQDSGISWVPAGDAEALARCLEVLAADGKGLSLRGEQAAATSERWFSNEMIAHQLEAILGEVRA